MSLNREKESEEPLFDISDRGYNVKAWYLKNTEESKGDSLVEISCNNTIVKSFLFPSYKIWNIAAHFSDIVNDFLDQNESNDGLMMAASTGLGSHVKITPLS